VVSFNSEDVSTKKRKGVPPASTIYLADPTTPNGIVNQALLFHEALHGAYGLQDSDLLDDFNYVPTTNFPSCKITDYLELKIWAGTIESCTH
jgi:hypothetical protein